MTLLLAACAGGPPVDTYLIRIDEPWLRPPPEIESNIRTAFATVLLFRSNGEYVEHHFWVIEQADKSLTMSAGDGHVIAIGSWRREGKGARATRRIVYRDKLQYSGKDPICEKPEVDFASKGDHVTGSIVGSSTVGEYRSSTRLELSQFEGDIEIATKLGTRCIWAQDHR